MGVASASYGDVASASYGGVLRRAGPRRQLDQARKAWVPDCSGWEPRLGGGTFSSGSALACRGSVNQFYPCNPGHDKGFLRGPSGGGVRAAVPRG